MIFLRALSAAYSREHILLITDGAAWHRSKGLQIPDNIGLLSLPPYTPEMNPIEQIWKALRKRGFKNEIFQALEKAVDRLCETIRALSRDTIKSITCRDWINGML